MLEFLLAKKKEIIYNQDANHLQIQKGVGILKKSSMIKIVSVILIMFSIGVFAGCAKTTSKPLEQKEDQLTIVTSFYPMYIATLNIIEGVPGINLVNMTPPITGCLHDYVLSTQDMKLLEDAQVFVINGAHMESFMEKVIQEMKHLHIIEASKGIELLEEAHEEQEEEEEEHEVGNPHVWVSITHAITQVRNIQEELAVLDPARAQVYYDNAQRYIEKLEALKITMHKELEGITQRDIVTFHEAFPYFAEEFGLNIIAVIEREPGSEPSAKELVETIEQVRASNIKALFAEPQYPSQAARTVATETGATVYTLDPIVTGPMEANAYLEIMNQNLKVLKEALQ